MKPKEQPSSDVIKIPTYEELVTNKEIAVKQDALNYLLNQEPPKQWVKKHPYISNYNYLPIDKVEFLLKRIFREYKVEVLETKMILNAITVNVRIHYLDPITNIWKFHDGVGAKEVQTQKETGALKMDMSNVNRGAVEMALPIAKTIAIKDAADHFGRLFGADLNRKDTINYTINSKLNSVSYED
jgi:hypothetical protein